MKVNPKDGRCRSCGGELDIIDADDISMTVACAECADTYQIETDALNDGGIGYYPEFLVSQMQGGDDVS